VQERFSGDEDRHGREADLLPAESPRLCIVIAKRSVSDPAVIAHEK
jgi:hypothetical protein